MRKPLLRVSFLLFIALCIPFILNAENNNQGGLPPAIVVVSGVETGMVSPETDFVGSVFYKEVSELTSEVSGVVEEFYFEDGDVVRKGEVVVRLSQDLLQKDLKSKRARYEEMRIEIDRAEKDFKRVKNLYSEDSVSEQLYDEHYFGLKALEKRLESFAAELERLEVELEKKSIRAPFDAVVIKRHIARGEWLSPGSKVGSFARYDTLDAVVDLPERVLGFIRIGDTVSIKAGGKTVRGRISGVVPKGDVSTRTFPVRIEISNPGFLKEGMEARVSVPSGKKRNTLLVHRDAVLTLFGKTVVFAVMDGKARMLPVEVAGFEGLKAGIVTDFLKEGMKVVVKGHERLSDGQPVNIK